MIKIDSIYKKYNRIEVLKNITTEFKASECIALIGPNGCGKTTLIKSILGMVIPNQGNIFFNNENISNKIDYRNEIGYMPQIGRYPENMSIGQIFEMMQELRTNQKNIDYDLYNAYKLNNILDKRMRTLSGGTTQKVSAALAFMFKPSVYILDEPTAGLDPLASEILKEKMLEEKSSGKLIIITSHLLNDLDELISEIVFMQEGELLIHQPINELIENTQEKKISKAIIKLLKMHLHE